MSADQRLDFAPRPGAAPLPRQIAAQAAMETRLMLRNGEQLLLALVIPVLALVGGVVAAKQLGLDFDHPVVDVLTPGVLALAVMSTAFTSLAIATGFERRYGVIKRLGASPLPRHGLLLGKVVALFLVMVLQAMVICAVAFALGWTPDGGPMALPVAVVAALVGTLAFGSLGLLLAGTVRAEATLAIANLVYLLLMMGGGVVLPRESYGAFGEVLRFLPSGALGDGLRAGLTEGYCDSVAMVTLSVWALVGAVLAGRYFKWE